VAAADGSGEARAWVVAPDEEGERLDVHLARRLAVGRAVARALLAATAVRIDGRRRAACEKGERVHAGSRIEVARFARPEALRVRPEPDPPLAVLARGEGWIAIDKPAGQAVRPLREEEGGTVLNALVARRPELQGVGEGGLRSGVVHRLDVDTSGVLLVATAAPAWTRLRAAFREHRVEKIYRAIVRGALAGEGEAALELRVVRHRPARVEAAAPGSGGRRAELRWRALERLAGATLVEVRPRTGFLHQIRATLAQLGHPVLGDRTYGSPEDAVAAPRQMLHAARLALDEIDVASPDPPDLVALRARLRSP
jgi:23S rRNA pseudouridine1911/1915/1917 synthase